MDNGNCINKELLLKILSSDEKERAEIAKILTGANIHMFITDSKNNTIFKTSDLIKIQNPPNLNVGNMNFFKFGERFYRLSMQEENQFGEFFTIVTYEDVTELILHIQNQRIANATLQEDLSTLRKDLSTDTRTELLSQRGFLEAIGGFKYDLEKDDAPFVLAMMDLDNFKSFNDNFGHTEGDKFLSFVGNLFKNSFRKNDAVGRYGGDEFIVALANCDLRTASEILKRLQGSFFSELCKFHNYNELKRHNFGISIGMVQYDNSLTYEENKDRADKALYYGKLHGKRHVIPYSKKLEDLHDRELEGETVTAEDIISIEHEFEPNNDTSNDSKNTTRDDELE